MKKLEIKKERFRKIEYRKLEICTDRERERDDSKEKREMDK